AYGSLLRERRRQCHARVAEALEEHFEGRAEARPEVVGHHYREAGDARRAIACYRRAAEQAFERSAHAESMHHCREGIDLTGEIPQEEERGRLELPLRIALGVTLIAARGYGNAEVAETHARARELCRYVGEGPDLYQAIGGLYVFYQGRMDLKPAAELAAQLLALGDEAGDPFVRQWGHFFSSVPLFYWGQYEASMEHLELALGDEATGEIPAWFRHEHEIRVSACSYAALALWALGLPDRARQRMEEAIVLGRRSSHPFNLAFGLSWATLGYQLRGEPEKVLELAAEAKEICGEQGFPAYLGLAQALHGWARTREARDPEGIDELREGLRLSATTGTRTEAPRTMGILAEAYQNLERWTESLATIDSALSVSQRFGCPYWDAELLRLRGEALWRREADAVDEAQACFERAAALARDQKAPGLELRAALSTARCLDSLGRRDDGREALKGVVESFTEGDDLPDLREARDLLTASRS
ncbi:MAG: hypothetical protein ACE5FL_09420, partial [Myxococcota bacterium]